MLACERGSATPWPALDADPRFYTTTVAADDLDDVRAALGYDRIDLYGTSYGGTLVQYYIRQHPEHVRVAVLDGATPLDVPVRERIAVNSQRALDLLLKRCEEDASCHSAFPDIVEEWSTLEAGLAQGHRRRPSSTRRPECPRSPISGSSVPRSTPRCSPSRRPRRCRWRSIWRMRAGGTSSVSWSRVSRRRVARRS